MRERIKVAGCLGAGYTPHGAAVDPARLARGLADVVEGMGVTIYERTPVTRLEPHVATTPFGDVRADVVVRATEAFTPELPGYERTLVPIYSLMIGTEPLPDAFWDEVGWSGHEVFGDFRFLIFYAMHTADGRIAIGGRGAPYHFGSRLSENFEREPAVREHLRALLGELFPAIGDAKVTHHWGGAIAAPRDWYTSVGLERDTGMAWAGAYVGDGVSTTNLAGRTLRDLILGRETELTGLPWVEPPLQAVGAGAAALDRRQRRPAGDGERGRRGAAHRPPEQAGHLREEDDRRLSLRPGALQTSPGGPARLSSLEEVRRGARVLGHRRVRRRRDQRRRRGSRSGSAMGSASASGLRRRQLEARGRLRMQ